MIHRKFVLVLAVLSAFAGLSSSPVYAQRFATTKTAAYTPAKGSAERKAILDSLRVVIRKMSGLEVIFVVRHLKVNNGWAWVEIDPESADGTQHYEPMVGLIHLKNERWIYVEGPPEVTVCEEDPDCIDSARYFKKLARKYPAVSPDIFPKP
ncbi:MAG: hypothetical protein ACREPB_03330 [Arenimonas sp.]